MGRQVLLAVICWLAVSQSLGEPKNEKDSAVAVDNESAESAPRLYHRGPLTVYASAVPYTPHQFKGHSVIAAGSQNIPVKASGNQGLINLKDSYGKYVQTHQSAYSPAYPQQFVPLQDLPPHLAQPLVSAAAPSFNFKAAPSFFYGPQSYKIQELQLPASHAAQFGSISQPLVYLNDLKSFAPSNLHSVHELHAPEHKLTITALNPNQPSQNLNQQSHHSNQQTHHSIHQTNHQAQHSNQPTKLSNQPTHHLNHQTYASTFQRLYEKPSQEITSFTKDTKQQGSHHQPGQIQAAPAQTSVTAIVNGKKTVINLETKPPIPLLNLDLLEPLKFDNPLVPQIQHFLPKVKGATYHKLPTYYNAKKGKKDRNKEFVVTKTTAYDSGTVKGKTYTQPKKQIPQTQKKPSKPGITVKGYPNSGDYSYEINTPNHKEVYNEQVIKYNKETNMKPVEFSYNEQTRKEPEVYTFVHSSKEPLKVTHVEYNSEDDGPKHIVYNLSPQEKDEEPSNKVNQHTSEEEDEDSGEDSSESEEEGPPPNSHHESQKYPQRNEHSSHHESPKYSQHNEHSAHRESSQYPPHHEEHNAPPPKHNEQHKVHRAPPKEYYHSSEYHSELPKKQSYYIKTQASPPPKQSQGNVFIVQETPKFHANQDGPLGPLILHESPRPYTPHHDSHHLHVEHRAQEYKQKPSQNGEGQVVQSFAEPLNKHQVVQSFAEPLYQPITPEYEEDIRILPTHKPHAAPIKVDPSQHLPNGPTVETFVSFNPPNNGAREGKNVPQQEHRAPQNYNSQQPHVIEKSRQIIIQENEETPEEKHMHMEQVMAEMLNREENSEEDFEKAYKESAYGFPAYEQVAEDVEKDIFDPDSYGAPRYQTDYNVESTPFQQYHKEDDKFPKFARLAYKDSRDNNQEDYFQEYSVHNPESYTDRIKSKVAYYKMFKKNKPEISFLADDNNKKEQKSAKFTLAPSYDFFKPSGPNAKQSKNVLVKYKAAPIKYGYDYSREAPRDSSAFASRPTFNKYKTHFVEPQLQYGFEPINAPLLYAESEMAGVASNDSPESETPGTRKKIYRENWYMKKTSTNSKPS